MELYVNREHLLKEIEYPARFKSENLFKSSAIIFVSLLVFLLLFKPFGMYAPEYKINYFFICSLHALCPALIIFVYFSILNYFKERKGILQSWTLLQEYSQIGIVLILTGISSFLIRDLIYDNPNNWSFNYLWEEIRNCFIAGTFFYFFLRLVSFYLQSKKGSPFVLQFVPLCVETPKKDTEPTLFINTQVKQDDFSLNIDDLLFVKADGNYIELTREIDKQIVIELKRISLTQFETQLSGYPHFFRCHRAYLVNMFKVEKVSGNSQGYLLSFHETSDKIPVSRKQLDSFNRCYEQLKQQNVA